MELDDMKLAWQTLDHRLEQQHALNVQIFRDGRLDTMRRGLRPLVWGQALQMAIGIAGICMFAPIWVTHLHDPAVLIAGVVMHLYCLGLIIVGAMVQGHIAQIDYAAPVLTIQRQLLKLRRVYAVGGAVVVGLPWWFLTAPLLVVLTRGAIMQVAPSVIWIQLAVGAAGLLATWWVHRWTRQPQRAALARKLDHTSTGSSIRRAQAAAGDIARFEQE
ncbi:serine/threonine protein kinase [Rhodanobacter sp. L36]|uniref:serine/threonine protein kinase n=1 Tax=Rhodanobacter sp. L36 TaxID=1747221 RepID=UPI00131BA04F|nr:serine/threonine protein kinase [Rhodanobacter sp. L36]